MGDSLAAVALAAGMLAAVNPCGFALLPAYLSLLVLGDDSPTRPRAVLRALGLTASMTLGFAAVFLAFGLAVAPFAAGVQRFLPWFTVVLGIALAGLGIWLALGRSLKLPTLNRGGGAPLRRSFVSMTGFGVSYALASLTCTAAPFLAVVVGGFRSDSLVEGLVLFLAYAGGMGLVVGTVAVATALAAGSLVRGARRAGAWVPRVSGVLLVLAGAYVAWYGAWELRVNAGGDAADPVVDAAAAVQGALAGWVRSVGALGWTLVLAAVVALVAGPAWWSRSRRGGGGVPAGEVESVRSQRAPGR